MREERGMVVEDNDSVAYLFCWVSDPATVTSPLQHTPLLWTLASDKPEEVHVGFFNLAEWCVEIENTTDETITWKFFHHLSFIGIKDANDHDNNNDDEDGGVDNASDDDDDNDDDQQYL